MDVGDLGSGGRVLPRRNRGLDRNGPPGLLAHSRGRLLRGLGGCPNYLCRRAKVLVHALLFRFLGRRSCGMDGS